MNQVLIRREDAFKLISLLGTVTFISAGSIWCEVVLNAEQLQQVQTHGHYLHMHRVI